MRRLRVLRERTQLGEPLLQTRDQTIGRVHPRLQVLHLHVLAHDRPERREPSHRLLHVRLGDAQDDARIAARARGVDVDALLVAAEPVRDCNRPLARVGDGGGVAEPQLERSAVALDALGIRGNGRQRGGIPERIGRGVGHGRASSHSLPVQRRLLMRRTRREHAGDDRDRDGNGHEHRPAPRHEPTPRRRRPRGDEAHALAQLGRRHGACIAEDAGEVRLRHRVPPRAS